MFSDKVHDAPPVIALLKVLEGERRQFRPPQPAAEQDSEHGAVAESFPRSDVWRIQQRLRLPKREPVTNAKRHGIEHL
jgi:hypothetical protein